MPVSDAARYAFKYVNGHPGNTALGLPTVMAFGVLADVPTGYPRLMSELTLTTAMRTAATSVVAAAALARPNARTMALIGNGAQSEFQALAFHDMLGIEEVRLFDIDSRATAKLMRNLAQAAPALHRVAGGQHGGRGARRRYRYDRHRGQSLRNHRDARNGRTRYASERGGRGLPRQDGNPSRYPAAGAHHRRIRAAIAHRRRYPAVARGFSRDRTVAGAERGAARARVVGSRSPSSIPWGSPWRTIPPCAWSRSWRKSTAWGYSCP